MLTIDIDGELERAGDALVEESAAAALSRSLYGKRLLTCSDADVLLHPQRQNAFFEALNYSYCYHRPFSLAPDAVWLLFLQGVSRHVNKNSETYRSLVVTHAGKQAVTVRKDIVKLGRDTRDWEEIIAAFDAQVSGCLVEAFRSAVDLSFTTSTKHELLAFRIAVLSAVQQYFNYALISMCGIPSIILEGELDDWRMLRDKTDSLCERFDLGFWAEGNRRFFDAVEQAYAGRYDTDFWSTIYREDRRSGGTRLDGWSTRFLVYLAADADRSATSIDDYGKPEGQPYVLNWRLLGSDETIVDRNIPNGIDTVPFVWYRYFLKHQGEFSSGFLGYGEQNGVITPRIGWYVTIDR